MNRAHPDIDKQIVQSAAWQHFIRFQWRLTGSTNT